MADINPNDSATLTDDLEIDSYDDVVNLFGADEAAAMLADVVGNRFNRQEILKAIRNGGDIRLDYWPEYGEYGYAARICGELLADTSLAWADGLIDPDKIKTLKGLTAGDLSHAVTCVLTDRFNDGLDEARLADCKSIADEFAQAIESRLGSGRLGRELYVDGDCLLDDLADKFGFSYDIDFSGLSFKTSLILSVNGLYSEGDVIDAARDWQEDYLPCVCHRGGQGEDDRWEYEPAEDYRPFTRPADIPESIFDKLCASQGTTIEKVVNDPVTPFERSFREDIFNMPQNRPVGLAVLATLPLDAFLDASLSMICRGEGENAGTFTVKPGTYEPILGIYDPVGGCGGTMGTVLDCDFEIDPHDISYTMMEPVRGEWKSDRIDLYTPQDCFGFSDPFGGRIEYSEKKPEIAVAVKPDPVELGHRAAVAASSTAGDRARAPGSSSRGAAVDNRDAKRKRPITCLESGATYDSAYRAAKELGFADSRNIFRSIQRGTCTQGLHFYYADEPKPAPEFFIPPNRAPRPVVCLDTGETFESAFQAGRAFGITPGGVRTSASTGVERGGLHFYYGDEPKPAPEFFRERHSKTRPIVCLETGETFMGNPAAAALCMYRPPRSARPSATDRP